MNTLRHEIHRRIKKELEEQSNNISPKNNLAIEIQNDHNEIEFAFELICLEFALENLRPLVFEIEELVSIARFLYLDGHVARSENFMSRLEQFVKDFSSASDPHQ